MADPVAKRPWEQRLHEAATTAEEEMRRVINYINDEVVPEVRLNSSKALRTAAAEMERLARRMEERPGAQTPAPPAGTK